MENITIRLEEERDWKEVELVTRNAFWRSDRISKIGIGATEHYIIHQMRGNEGIDELSFVAEYENKIVGHIVYSSQSYILHSSGEKTEVLNFGPISVAPEYQNLGIGSKLISHSLIKAKELGYGAILFFGHPTYYPRFGYKEAKEFGITTELGDNFPAFMAMELQVGFLKCIQGRFIESSIYNEDLIKEAARDFDKTFMSENLTHCSD